MTLTQQKLRCRQGFRSLSEGRLTTPSPLGPRADRAISLAAAVVAAHGVLVLVGWWAGWPLFVRPPQDFIPMAPSTALAFVMLGLALVGRRAGAAGVRRAGSVAAWTVAVVSLVDPGFPAWLDHLLGGATGQIGPQEHGGMSPIKAVLRRASLGRDWGDE